MAAHNLTRQHRLRLVLPNVFLNRFSVQRYAMGFDKFEFGGREASSITMRAFPWQPKEVRGDVPRFERDRPGDAVSVHAKPDGLPASNSTARWIDTSRPPPPSPTTPKSSKGSCLVGAASARRLGRGHDQPADNPANRNDCVKQRMACLHSTGEVFCRSRSSSWFTCGAASSNPLNRNEALMSAGAVCC